MLRTVLVVLIFGFSTQISAQVESPARPPQESQTSQQNPTRQEAGSKNEGQTGFDQNVLLKIWRFEIIRLEDRPVTVSKIFTGLFLLALGIWLARFSSRRVQKFLEQTGVNPSTTAATRTLLFYLLVIISTMITLEMIEVPLTVFTLLGGAVAIGVGFGSQNLINNFISGLILLAERPIRVGDLIQVGDLYGTVASIGARSTAIKTGSNIHLIIPNSAFLEQNVINWTLGDDLFRAQVTVGLAYGSPTTKVKDLLLKATQLSTRVLPHPKPIILFTDFGDNALIFEVHFWIKMRNIMERRLAESELRFLINDVFDEAGLVIAFPQRDIHFDKDSPLEIKILEKRVEN